MPEPAAPPTAPATAPKTDPTTAPARAAEPAASDKLAKTVVQYQSQPKGAQQCALCQHFVAESNTCRLVEGPISPTGWCVLWVKKA